MRREVCTAPPLDPDETVEEDSVYLVASCFHIKWYALAKHLLLFFLLVSSMQIEASEPPQQCPAKSCDNCKDLVTTDCLRSSCLWVAHIVGTLPGNLARNHSAICSFMQAVAFFSCLSVITIIYCRQRRMHLTWTFRRCLVCLFAVVPSALTEFFIVFFWFYALVMSVTLKLQPSLKPEPGGTLRTFVLAIVLSICAFFEVILHAMSMFYLMSFPKEEQDPYLSSNYPVDSLLEQARNHSLMSRRGVASSVRSAPRQLPRGDEDPFLLARGDFRFAVPHSTPPAARSLRVSRFMSRHHGGSFPRSFCPPVNNSDMRRRLIERHQQESPRASTYDQINYAEGEDQVVLTPRHSPPPPQLPAGRSPDVPASPSPESNYAF